MAAAFAFGEAMRPIFFRQAAGTLRADSDVGGAQSGRLQSPGIDGFQINQKFARRALFFSPARPGDKTQHKPAQKMNQKMKRCVEILWLLH